ncbi:MAG: c-type cytochrome [Candidatus Hodgkinia cicadicola]|nr:MAG: c-type cytochrome [Candidatus Hodgkinia cicadicola]
MSGLAQESLLAKLEPKLVVAKAWYLALLSTALVVLPFALASNSLFPNFLQTSASLQVSESKSSFPLMQLLLSSSVARGRKFFSRCFGCHSIERSEQHKAGPNLWNVLFNKTAFAKGFSYSPALKALSQPKWGFEALNKFLKSPSSYAKGTYMSFSGLADDSARMDLLSYLNFKSNSPYDISRFKFKAG